MTSQPVRSPLPIPREAARRSGMMPPTDSEVVDFVTGRWQPTATHNSKAARALRRAAFKMNWTAGARAMVLGWTDPRTLVVVTHGANILPLTGVTPEEGGMVIVKPDPSSVAKLRTLGHIPQLPLGP